MYGGVSLGQAASAAATLCRFHAPGPFLTQDGSLWEQWLRNTRYHLSYTLR